MEKPLWKFIDNQGTFVSDNAHQIKSLYFPLCNTSPLMSSISPDLHGDIKSGFRSFLLEPVSRLDLSNSKTSRNFWIYVNPKKIWSATGVSKNIEQIKEDKFQLEAGLLWQKVTRQNKNIGLSAEITSFVPSSGEPIEIMLVSITNISKKTTKFTPTAAIPVFARSAHNLHDHRHVSSLLQRIQKEKLGILVTSTLIFDEAGHKKDSNVYFVLGLDEKNKNAPQYIYPTQEEFTGEGSDLEAPDAIFNNLLPEKNRNIQGKDAMGALRFKVTALKPKQNASYIILMGITKDKSMLKTALEKFNSKTKIEESLRETKSYWQKISLLTINSGDSILNNWFKWVGIQPALRKIFGCSFLPDFDYGKGGRGWRDLWQDCLSLVLSNPRASRSLLINNFSGVRIDGSNATIIADKPGEFIADRNNVSRVWMDHGIWPLLTTHLYIHQSGDLKILLSETTYFRDPQICRSKEKDSNWNPAYDRELKTKNRAIYKGTLLEHILVQNLVQFFNVGPHNHVRLENADWNDGLDMAPDFGESVAFSSMYAQNLKTLGEIIARLDTENIILLKELTILLDSLGSQKLDYADINAKHKVLEKYLQSTKYQVNGEKVTLPKAKVIADLKRKAETMYAHIRKHEWLKEGFFNGYYNDDKERVEGNTRGLLRMTLTGQVFPIISAVATAEQIKETFSSASKYLKDKKLGGFHLNTDFKTEQLNLGRAFSFVYGDKENGAFFNHMCVMFAYALYKQGFIKEGYEVLSSIYNMAQDTKNSKIYPCLPEYFNAEGRGMYSYLTGSASWLILTVLTEVFGIKGEYGNLVIEPKLVSAQFKNRNTVSITACFADRPIEVKFTNRRKKDSGKYFIRALSLNGKKLAQNIKSRRFVFERSYFISLTHNQNNIIEVTLD